MNPTRAGGSRAPRFVRRKRFDQPDLVGARWWLEGLDAPASAVSRRTALLMLGGLGVAVAGAGTAIWFAARPKRGSVLEGIDASRRASLDLQREAGWDAGHPGGALAWPNASDVDAHGTAAWRQALATLDRELEPKQAALARHAVPTLFQSLGSPRNERLRESARPIFSSEMAVAYDKGTSLVPHFDGIPPEIAVVADMPGEEAVAFAAGLAERLEPVFLFDNWPHPVGVVPSQLPLGAALYQLPRFRLGAAARATRSAPALFVLDSRRLSPYTDAPDLFDNRYLARLPSADAMKALGAKHVLYVKKDAADLKELDDLNDLFVAYRDAGIDVKVLPLSDFSRAAALPATAPGVAPASTPAERTPYRYGGGSTSPMWLWFMYGWFGRGMMPVGLRPGVSAGSAYRPERRNTIFSGAGGAPAGFGTAALRRGGARSSGGRTSGRSGSIGRTYSGGSG